MPRIVFTLESGEPLECLLSDSPVLIGRHKDCDTQILSSSVSNRHARIERDGDVWTLVDLGSTNGSSVNGEPANSPLPIRDGDVVKCGDIIGQVELSGKPASGADRGSNTSSDLPASGPGFKETEDEDVDYDEHPLRKSKKSWETKKSRLPDNRGKKKVKSKDIVAENSVSTDSEKSAAKTKSGSSDIMAELARIRKSQDRPNASTWFLAFVLLAVLGSLGLTVRHVIETGRWTFFQELFGGHEKAVDPNVPNPAPPQP